MEQEKDHSMVIILTLGFAALIGTMNNTLFNVALPALMVAFQTDVVTVQWLSSGYMLAAGVATPAAAFLGNRIGYKRLLVLLLTMTACLAVIGGFCGSIELLILVRVLFGFSAGLLCPITMATLYITVPPRKQAAAAGMWGSAVIIGGALPTVLSGAIISFASWHWLFWFMAPVCCISLACVQLFLPKDSPKTNSSIDSVGLVLTAGASFILLFSFSSLSRWGFSPQFFACVLVGFLLMSIYVKRSWNNPNALLNLEVFKYPRYVAAVVFDMVAIVAMYSIVFMIPLFLQNGLGFSAAMTGLIMLPCCAVPVVIMPLATKILSTQGEKVLAFCAIGVLAGGTLLFIHPWYGMPAAFIIFVLCIRSVGLGFMNLLTTNTAMAAVPKELSGHASSLYNWQKQLIGALTTSIASNIVGFRIASAHATTAKEISDAYLSSTGMLMGISSLLLICILPIAFKYFRSKDEMPKA